MATSPKRRKKEPVELLIIVCNPDREGARLAEASAEADAVLKKCRDKRVERRDSCTVEQLRDQLVELRPRMLLFIGHGDAKHKSSDRHTLALTTEAGDPVIINPDVIIDVLSAQALERLEIVVLNGCCSEKLGAAVASRGVAAVCWTTRLLDGAAGLFSTALFQDLTMELDQGCAVLGRRRMWKAFEQAKLAVSAKERPTGSSDCHLASRGDMYAMVDPDNPAVQVDGCFGVGVPRLMLPPNNDIPGGAIPECYVRRPELEASHRDALLRDGSMAITARTTGVCGPAGAGKSTMAAILAQDPSVNGHFCDGITWLTFGQEKTGDDVLRTLAKVIGVDGSEPSPRSFVRTISAALKGQRRLLILDDVWTEEQLHTFERLKAEGGQLGRLITTRNHDLAGNCRKTLTKLEDDEGLKVFAGWIRGHLLDFERGEKELEDLKENKDAVWLVEKCSGNPAMIRAVAGLCRRRPFAAMRKHLEQCRKKLKKGGDLLPSASSGRRSDVYGTLFDLLDGTLNQLGVVLKKRCTMLAVFPEDTQVPLAVIAQLWGTDLQETNEEVDHLMKWHVVDVDWDEQTLTLIDLHLDYLRSSAKDDLVEWHCQLLRQSRRRNLGPYEVDDDETEGGEEDEEEREASDSYWGEAKNVAHHLEGGGRAALNGMTHLWTLNLTGCAGLKTLPSFTGLTALRELNLEGCSGLTLTSLPSFERDELPDLRKITRPDGTTFDPGIEGLSFL